MLESRASDRPARRRTFRLVGLGLFVAWVATLSVLILTAPPPGAGSAAELVERASAALDGGDAEAFGTLLAPPLDREFAESYLARLQQAGAAEMVVEPGPRDLIEVRGRLATGPFLITLVAVTEDGRWFLSALPPI